MTGLYRPLLEPLGLTYPQYLVMLVLWEHPDSTVKDLGAALMLDSGTLSPLLKRLEAAGLVTRRRDHDDERCLVVSLTPEGERLADRVSCVPEAAARASGLTLTELVGLRDTLVALTGKVTAATVAEQQSEGVHG
jgi:DNA-binding MarR family transcriptional regulator